MATTDEEFIERLRATFKVEAEEHLQAISGTLLELEKSESGFAPTAAIENVYREAHSLKGAARAVDYSDVEAICQAIEGVFSDWKKEFTSPNPDSLDALHRALDMIHQLLESSGAGVGPSESRPRDELIRRLALLQPNGSAAGRRSVSPAIPAPLESGTRTVAVKPMAVEPVAPTVHPPVEPEKSAAAQTVRIPIDKLDAHLLQAEDMLAVKAVTVQRAAELREVSGRFDQWQREWGKISIELRTLRQAMQTQEADSARAPSVAATAAMVNFLDWNFDYLRSMQNRLASLTSQAEQDRHGVGRRVDDLLEDSKKLLMLPFSTLSAVFPKLIRDLCRDQGKEAELVVCGGDVEIDKRILEGLKDALIHILRNCVDHGVESPQERERRQKPARAVITISVSALGGSQVEILVSDDGAGVDVARVKDSAIRHGIISAAEAAGLGDTDALDLIFHSDVSTSPVITAISGRGLGMAIVRAQCEKLGGRVAIENAPGKGCTVRMVLPPTLATFRGVLLSVGDRLLVVPTINVERALRIRPTDIQTVENRQAISLDGRAVSLVRLDAVLGIAGKTGGADESKLLTVAILHWSDVRVAFVVDQVLREEEVLVKPLRKPLVRVRNIAGVTLLASGKTAPVLNVADLMQSARAQGGAPPAPAVNAAPVRAPAKRVLVAEDSITSRMLLKGILEGAGYRVTTAVDGMDAFTVLRETKFDVLVSDVEMPRMNGFDLTTRIRADKRLGDLPVVLVSALESRQERERGIDAGASAYIIKSSFDQSNLLEAVGRLA